jgi:hypothetical protein
MATRRLSSRGVLTAAAIVLAACGRNPELVPASGANVVQGPGESAIAADAGVRLTVQAQAWDADPANLHEVMTPLRVELFNGSDQPIQVRSQEFQLVTSSGERMPAIPPYDIDKTVAQRVEVPHAYPYDPYYHYGYYDDYFWDTVVIDLPTDQMVAFALPEGVIEPGGNASGFLYFDDIDEDETRARLEMHLVNAGTGAQFGQIQIPFTVH